MMNIIKDLIAKIKLIEPSMLALISLSPFIMGLIAGYALRTPISWALDLARVALKIL